MEAPQCKPGHISTHALREEGDKSGPITYSIGEYISTHALREEGDRHAACPKPPQKRISTHALREEGDNPLATSARPVSSFLPTPSARRATR